MGKKHTFLLVVTVHHPRGHVLPRTCCWQSCTGWKVTSYPIIFRLDQGLLSILHSDWSVMNHRFSQTAIFWRFLKIELWLVSFDTLLFSNGDFLIKMFFWPLTFDPATHRQTDRQTNYFFHKTIPTVEGIYLWLKMNLRKTYLTY